MNPNISFEAEQAWEVMQAYMKLPIELKNMIRLSLGLSKLPVRKMQSGIPAEWSVIKKTDSQESAPPVKAAPTEREAR